MRLTFPVAAAAGAGVAALAGAGPVAPSGAASGERVVTLVAHYSRFTPARVDVPAGTTVRFVVHNTDPVDHELIVGDQAVHDRHERGTEAHHGERPGEVSVPAGATASTTYRFGRRGTVVFGCHLPGHWAYGMRGEVDVR